MVYRTKLKMGKVNVREDRTMIRPGVDGTFVSGTLDLPALLDDDRPSGEALVVELTAAFRFLRSEMVSSVDDPVHGRWRAYINYMDSSGYTRGNLCFGYPEHNGVAGEPDFLSVNIATALHDDQEWRVALDEGWWTAEQPPQLCLMHEDMGGVPFDHGNALTDGEHRFVEVEATRHRAGERLADRLRDLDVPDGDVAVVEDLGPVLEEVFLPHTYQWSAVVPFLESAGFDLSGSASTSPHVSGQTAEFLPVRREYRLPGRYRDSALVGDEVAPMVRQAVDRVDLHNITIPDVDVMG